MRCLLFSFIFVKSFVVYVLQYGPHSQRMFFFQRSVDHRVLHSFPTRRSSDLTALYEIVPVGGPRTADDLRYGAQRSEEHTSELQSHSDLVCRLLLEKKKKKSQCHLIRLSI